MSTVRVRSTDIPVVTVVEQAASAQATSWFRPRTDAVKDGGRVVVTVTVRVRVAAADGFAPGVAAPPEKLQVASSCSRWTSRSRSSDPLRVETMPGA